jgi:acyl carrier protein
MKTDILKELQLVFEEELDEDDFTLTEASTANEVEGWDSLTHVQIVVAVEKSFGIKFKSAEISEFKNVGDMIRAIEVKV